MLQQQLHWATTLISGQRALLFSTATLAGGVLIKKAAVVVKKLKCTHHTITQLSCWKRLTRIVTATAGMPGPNCAGVVPVLMHLSQEALPFVEMCCRGAYINL